jgi:hypothetical protein
MEGEMGEGVQDAERQDVRRWLARWRAVNEKQDELARSEPAPDAGTLLESGLSLIEFAFALQRPTLDDAEARKGSDAVRATWRRLRDRHR